MSKYKKYITYFQKVTTIGILTCGKDYEEAEQEAKLMINDKNLPNRCFYEETELECSDTVEWNPNIDIISIDPHGDGLDMTISMNDKYTKVIADSLGKPTSELTNDDFQTFVKSVFASIIEKEISKINE